MLRSGGGGRGPVDRGPRMAGIALLAAVGLVASAVLVSAAASPAGASSTPTKPMVAAAGQSSNLSKGPVGWDTYRNLGALPTLPVGVQTQQFASTNPSGQNADFNHTLGRTPSGAFILARHQGPGEIDSIWTTSNGGDVTQTGNITVTLDGTAVLNDSEQNVVNGGLGAPFVFPLVANANQSSGGNYIDVPMTFRSSMMVTTTNDPAFYHVDYRNYADATGVSTFSRQDAANDVVSELAAAGTQDPKGPQPGQGTDTIPIAAPAGQTDVLKSYQGPGRINALQLTLPQLSLQAVAPTASPSTAASGPTTLAISPNNAGVQVTRHLQSGSGAEGADILVGGRKVASLPPPPPGGPASKAHWGPQSVTLPSSVTAGQSTIQVVPSGSGSKFAYQTTGLTSAAATPAISAADDVLQNVRLQITFDGHQTPDVDAPLGQFFGSGLGEASVSGLMVAVNVQTNTLSAWWPMPYGQQATVALDNRSQQILSGGTAQITTAPVPGETDALGPSGQDGYFHATAKAQNPTVSGQDYPFLSTGGWGKFVGVSETMQGLGVGAIATPECFLEGNEQAYSDGSPTPQVDGTGTEDFYQGGWYFNRGAFSDPLNGSPAQQGTGTCQNAAYSAYRLMLADAVPFSSFQSFGIQHGGLNTTPTNYSSTAYWYGRSGASPGLYHALPLQNGWTQAGGANPPSYVLEGNFVRLLGGVAGGAVGQPIATLPPGLAPDADEWFPVVTANNVVAPLVVHRNGSIVLNAGNTGFVSLSGIVLDVGSSTAYQPLALQNGWSPAGGTDLPGWSPGYVQNGSSVELTGGLTGGTPGQVVATLPANLRPPADDWFSVVTANNVVAPLVVHPDGTIVLNAGNPGFLSLSGVGVMVGAAPPSNLNLQNGWSPAPGTNAPGFAQEGTEVDLRGGLGGGQTGQAIATLPSGSRPAADESFPTVTAGNVVAPLVVHSDGTIVLNGGNPGFLSLEDVRVSTDVASAVSPNPPGAPTIGEATPGNASATVAFTPPSSDGGSPIINYTAMAADQTNASHGGQSGNGAGSSIVVSGLTPGDTYTFTVTATNAGGTGPPSAPSNAVVPAKPVAEPVVSSPQYGVANQTDVFTVASDGALDVYWVQGGGGWNGPLAISGPGTVPTGGHLAVSTQFGVNNQTDVFFVGTNGATEVVWVQGAGAWQGPLPITPANTAPPGAGLAVSPQYGVNNQTDVFVVGTSGATDVSWVAGGGGWQGPMPITPANNAPAGASLAVSPQYGVSNQTDVFVVASTGATDVSWVAGAGNWNGPMPITPANTAPPGAGLAGSPQYGVNNQTDVFVVANSGATDVSWVAGAGNWQGPLAL